MLFNKIRGQK